MIIAILVLAVLGLVVGLGSFGYIWFKLMPQNKKDEIKKLLETEAIKHDGLIVQALNDLKKDVENLKQKGVN